MREFISGSGKMMRILRLRVRIRIPNTVFTKYCVKNSFLIGRAQHFFACHRSNNTLSRFHIVTLSRCRVVTLSRCRVVALSRCYVVMLSRYALSRCCVVALSLVALQARIIVDVILLKGKQFSNNDFY